MMMIPVAGRETVVVRTTIRMVMDMERAVQVTIAMTLMRIVTLVVAVLALTMMEMAMEREKVV